MKGQSPLPSGERPTGDGVGVFALLALGGFLPEALSDGGACLLIEVFSAEISTTLAQKAENQGQSEARMLCKGLRVQN